MSNYIDKDLKDITLRKEQKEALGFVFDTIKNNGNIKNILLDLPTGVGKSILALSICQQYLKDVNPKAKFDILTNSKILQEQYFEEFVSPANLWGKKNYDCTQYSCSCDTGKEFNKINKTKCEECPYDNSKNSYLHSKVNLTNFHLYITFRIYQEEYFKQRESNVLIVDESHDFEQVFSDFIAINLTELGIKKLGLAKQTQILKSIKSIRDMDMFVDFCEEFLLNEISSRMAMIKSEISGFGDTTQINRDLKIDNLFGEKTNTKVKRMKILSDLENYTTKINHFLKDYASMPENWVMDTTINKNNQKEINIQPVWAYPYLDRYIWSKYDHVIMMSGTILDKDMFSHLNGLSVHQTEYYSIDSPFVIKNRPIYYMPIGRMTYTKKVETFEKYIPIINKILNKYKNKKGVLHTHTYELAEWTKEKIKNDRLIFHDSDSKDRALKIHYKGDDASVLCSPSMATGVNLENDRARFQVLFKVPYPSLASKKNKMRQKTMPEWYTWKTIAGIIQAYGRAVRSYNDHSDFIILDGCFSDIMLHSGDKIPKWVMNAIQRVDVHKAVKNTK